MPHQPDRKSLHATAQGYVYVLGSANLFNSFCAYSATLTAYREPFTAAVRFKWAWASVRYVFHRSLSTWQAIWAVFDTNNPVSSDVRLQCLEF